MKYRPEPEPTQESFLLGILFGIFVLPWLLIEIVGTAVDIGLKIRARRDKKDPSRKIDRLVGWLKDGFVKDMFSIYETTEDGREEDFLCDFKDSDKKASLAVKDLPDYNELIDKFGKWCQCVNDISAMTNMNDAGKQIQKIFSKYFTNKDLYTRTDKNGIQFTGINVTKKNSRYPSDIWFKDGSIEKFVTTIDDLTIKLTDSLIKMSEKVKECLKSPDSSKKEDKTYLAGCLNYIATVDKVVDITQSTLYHIDWAGETVCDVWYKLNK